MSFMTNLWSACFATDKQLEDAHNQLFDPIWPVRNKKTDLCAVFAGTVTSGFVARHAAAEYRAGRFEKIVVAGGGPTDNPGLRKIMKHLDPESLLAIEESDYQNDLTEGALMRQVLIAQGVPDAAIKVVGEDQTNMDGVVDAVMRSAFAKAADSMSVIAYGPGAQRVRSTIRFQNADVEEGALFDKIDAQRREKQAFEGAIVPMVAGVGKMQPENWRETLIARFYVMAERHNMLPERAGRGGYIGKYCLDPAEHRAHEDALIDALPDFVRRDL